MATALFYSRCLQDLPKVNISDVHRIVHAGSSAPRSTREKGFKFYISSYIDNYEGKFSHPWASQFCSGKLADSQPNCLTLTHFHLFLTRFNISLACFNFILLTKCSFGLSCAAVVVRWRFASSSWRTHVCLLYVMLVNVTVIVFSICFVGPP